MGNKQFITSLIEAMSTTFEYYQNEIEKFDKNIQKRISKLQTAKKNFNSSFLNCEKELLTLNDLNNTLKLNLDEKIKSLKEETDEKINEYIVSLNIPAEVQKLIKTENDNYHGKWLYKKKKRQELNHKINSMERDYNQKLIDYDEQKNINQKTYKAKVQEEIKKMGIDLQRAEANVTKACNVIEKDLLDINDAKGINESKKKLKELRRKALEDNEKLKISYYKTIYDLSVNYANQKLALDDEISKTRFDYQTKINALKKERLEMELDEKHENLVHLLEVEKKRYIKQTEFKNIVNDFKKCENKILSDKIKDSYQEIVDGKEKYSNNLEKLILESLSFDKEQLEFLKETTSQISEMKNQDDEMKNVFLSIVKSFAANLIFSLEDMIEKRFICYKKIVNQLIISYHKKDSDLTTAFSPLFESVNSIIEKQKKTEWALLNTTKGKIYNELENIMKSIDNIFNNIDDYHKKEIDVTSSLTTELDGILDGYKDVVTNNTKENINILYRDLKEAYKKVNDDDILKEKEIKNELEKFHVDKNEKLNQITNDISNQDSKGCNETVQLEKECMTLVNKVKEQNKISHIEAIKQRDKEIIEYDDNKKEKIKEVKEETLRLKKTL